MGNLRHRYLLKLIDWQIGTDQNRQTDTGRHGRYLKRYLTEPGWRELEATFAGPDPGDFRKAFRNMLSLFGKLAKRFAETKRYEFPETTFIHVTDYCEKVLN